MKNSKIVAAAVAAMLPLVVSGGVGAAQGQNMSRTTATHGEYRDYTLGNRGNPAVQFSTCGKELAKRSGSWVCPSKFLPSSLRKAMLEQGATIPAAAPYPIVVTHTGTWVQPNNYTQEYTLGGFAYGFGTKTLGYGSWDVIDPVSGGAIQTSRFQIMFSAAVGQTVFTAERITTDKSASGTPISGTYQDIAVPSIPGNTTANHPVSPKFDNVAKTIFVAHEVTWSVPGYTGRWYTYMYSYLLHNTNISGAQKYLYDIAGHLPPNAEGGQYVLN